VKPGSTGDARVVFMPGSSEQAMRQSVRSWLLLRHACLCLYD
jgi:hypothetical protein